jgi:hypothetical protein
MTDEPSWEVPMSVVPLLPKPEACLAPTVASFTVETLVRDTGLLDVWVDYTRSCGHGPVHRAWRIPEPLPVIGEPALSCGGPPVETAESGRADKSLPSLKKGLRWTKVKGPKVA